MSSFKKGSTPNGQFWYGKYGFLYKKNSGCGSKRSTQFTAGGNLITNQPTYLYNKYKPGGEGIGASNTFNRRKKNKHASICNNNECGRFYSYLGMYNRYLYNPNGYFPYPPIPQRVLNPNPTPSPPVPPIPPEVPNPYQANSPWPENGGLNNFQTRLSPFLGSQTGTLLWSTTPIEDYIPATNPVISGDGTIYLIFYVRSLANYIFASLNPQNGNIILSTQLILGDYIYANFFTSPAIGIDGTIYIATENNYLYAFNPDTSIKWRTLLPLSSSVQTSPILGLDINGNNIVYILCNSSQTNLYAVDNLGDILPNWPISLNGAVRSGPSMGLDGTIYVSARTTTSNVYAINPSNISIKWLYTSPFPNSGGYACPSISLDGSTIYLYASTFGRDLVLSLTALNSQTGDVKWRYIDNTDRIFSASQTNFAQGPDGTIYIIYHARVDGIMSLQAISSLGAFKWRYDYPGTSTDPFRIPSPLVGSDGTIYMNVFSSFDFGSTISTTIVALNPDGTLKWQWDYPVPGVEFFSTGNSMALARDGTLYLNVFIQIPQPPPPPFPQPIQLNQLIAIN